MSDARIEDSRAIAADPATSTGTASNPSTAERLGPIPEGAELRLAKPARRRFDPSLLSRIESERLISEVLDDLRGGR